MILDFSPYFWLYMGEDFNYIIHDDYHHKKLGGCLKL